MSKSNGVLQGSLDPQILKVPNQEAMHGWAIAQCVKLLSKDILRVNQGASYPALNRLEYRAWIEATSDESENNCRAKYYALTDAGHELLEKAAASWGRLSPSVLSTLEVA